TLKVNQILLRTRNRIPLSLGFSGNPKLKFQPMNAATLAQLKKELQFRSPEEVQQVCMRLARFKKENKQLLTYLLFESDNEQGFVDAVKVEVEELFFLINPNSYHYIKKSVRKILATLRKYIRYSGNKETEVELLLHYCDQLKSFRPSIKE